MCLSNTVSISVTVAVAITTTTLPSRASTSAQTTTGGCGGGPLTLPVKNRPAPPCMRMPNQPASFSSRHAQTHTRTPAHHAPAHHSLECERGTTREFDTEAWFATAAKGQVQRGLAVNCSDCHAGTYRRCARRAAKIAASANTRSRNGSSRTSCEAGRSPAWRATGCHAFRPAATSRRTDRFVYECGRGAPQAHWAHRRAHRARRARIASQRRSTARRAMPARTRIEGLLVRGATTAPTRAASSASCSECSMASSRSRPPVRGVCGGPLVGRASDLMPACEAGKRSGVGAVVCESCIGGRYSLGGTANCTDCGAGNYSSAGAGSCAVCDGGRYSGHAAAICEKCESGSYSSEGSAKCERCEPGRYSGTGASTCGLCDSGKYSQKPRPRPRTAWVALIRTRTSGWSTVRNARWAIVEHRCI